MSSARPRAAASWASKRPVASLIAVRLVAVGDRVDPAQRLEAAVLADGALARIDGGLAERRWLRERRPCALVGGDSQRLDRARRNRCERDCAQRHPGARGAPRERVQTQLRSRRTRLEPAPDGGDRAGLVIDDRDAARFELVDTVEPKRQREPGKREIDGT